MNQYLKKLIREFGIETHLGSNLWPNYAIAWDKLDLEKNGTEYARPLKNHERLFTEANLELLEVLTEDIKDTGHRISVKFDQDYLPIIRLKRNLRHLVEVA